MTEPARLHVTRRVTKMEYGVIVMVVAQLVALIWGAATLKVGVDNLTTTVQSMSDYSVLRYRVDQNDLKARANEVHINALEQRLNNK
jgi:Flp pilus assembly pilin Flp